MIWSLSKWPKVYVGYLEEMELSIPGETILSGIVHVCYAIKELPLNLGNLGVFLTHVSFEPLKCFIQWNASKSYENRKETTNTFASCRDNGYNIEQMHQVGYVLEELHNTLLLCNSVLLWLVMQHKASSRLVLLIIFQILWIFCGCFR